MYRRTFPTVLSPVHVDPEPFPVPEDPASLLFTDGAVREVARIALERGTGARGLRSVVEEVVEAVLFDVEAGVRYVITDKTVRGGEPLKQSLSQQRARLYVHLLRRFRARKSS